VSSVRNKRGKANRKFQITNSKNQITNSKSQKSNHKFQITKIKLQIAIPNLFTTNALRQTKKEERRKKTTDHGDRPKIEENLL
jgi:hypothetical protein